MPKASSRKLDFEVDKLTNSIEEAVTGAKIETRVVPLGSMDSKRLSRLKWDFDWGLELVYPRREVYALLTEDDPLTLQGLISIEEEYDHMYMHLLEAAPTNRGRGRKYEGVAGNLVAFLCKKSFERGHEGNIAFESKTRLIEHYKTTLGAQLIAGTRMLIETSDARRLVTQYFPKFEYDRL